MGKGRVTYVGAVLDDLSLARAGPKGRVYVAINWNSAPQTVYLPAPMTDLLSGDIVPMVTLARYEIAVLAPR